MGHEMKDKSKLNWPFSWGGKDDGLFGGTGNDKLWDDDQNETMLVGQYHDSDYLDGDNEWRLAA
jgi:hypothetical protein